MNGKIKFIRQSPVCVVSIIFCMLLTGCGKKAPQKVYRVGIMSGTGAYAGIAEGFKAEMTRLGYIEDENIIYDVQKLNADPAAERRVAMKFVKDKVDLIFAFPTGAALAAKTASGGNIPVVFAIGATDNKILVDSILEPGGNITGVRFPGSETTVRSLEILHELAPQAKRVFIAHDINYPIGTVSIEQMSSISPLLGITLVEVPVSNMEELQSNLQARDKSADIGIDAILMMPEALTQSPACWAIISKFAEKHKIPVGGSAGFEADTGAVFSYYPNNIETGSLAAPLADKILKGAPAGQIPVVAPVSRLRVNCRAAKGLGLNLSEDFLKKADDIIR